MHTLYGRYTGLCDFIDVAKGEEVVCAVFTPAPAPVNGDADAKAEAEADSDAHVDVRGRVLVLVLRFVLVPGGVRDPQGKEGPPILTSLGKLKPVSGTETVLDPKFKFAPAPNSKWKAEAGPESEPEPGPGLEPGLDSGRRPKPKPTPTAAPAPTPAPAPESSRTPKSELKPRAVSRLEWELTSGPASSSVETGAGMDVEVGPAARAAGARAPPIRRPTSSSSSGGASGSLERCAAAPAWG